MKSQGCETWVMERCLSGVWRGVVCRVVPARQGRVRCLLVCQGNEHTWQGNKSALPETNAYET